MVVTPFARQACMDGPYKSRLLAPWCQLCKCMSEPYRAQLANHYPIPIRVVNSLNTSYEAASLHLRIPLVVGYVGTVPADPVKTR
jgi:hypothetical protein